MVLEDFTLQTVIILGLFLVVVYFMYKTFRMVLKAVLFILAAFSFPWILQLLGLNLGITADIETGIRFAFLGLGLFVLWQAAHFVKLIIKVVTWPFRRK